MIEAHAVDQRSFARGRCAWPVYAAVVSLLLAPRVAVTQDLPPAAREWGARAGAFQLSIYSDKKSYANGEPILLSAVMKNVSDNWAFLVAHTPFEFYDIDIRIPFPSWMPFKPRAALTPFGRERKYPRETSLRGGDVQAGRESVDQFELNKLYYMSAPGDYRIVVSCRLRSKGGQPPMTAVSNEIVITVEK